jgi:hypothetical protein
MSGEVISLQGVRDLALALPGSSEAGHWGNPSFRIRGKIFATVPDSGRLNVMIDPFEVDGVVRDHPEACSQLWWGKEVRGVQVSLGKASRELVAALLGSAWRRKATRSLAGSPTYQNLPRPKRT